MAQRPISPQEYDEAVARWPHLCPLLIMGDRRSGQQLLDDAPVDTALTLSSLARCLAGRRLLDKIAECLEHEIAEIERVTPSTWASVLQSSDFKGT